MAIQNEVRYTLSLRDLMTSALNRVKGTTDKVNDSVKKTNKSLLDMSKAGNYIKAAFGTAAVISFGRQVIEATKNYEYFSASLRTLMHGDVQTAQALEAQLVELAKKTPFSLEEVQDATKQLMAYGFSAGSVTKNIRMLGDVASALKIPFGDIAYIYGTLRTQGRAYTRDIMQFTQRGIPVIGELAKQYNTTTQNAMKMVEQGKVGFADIEKAFVSMTSKGGMFYNMMNEQSKTLGGRLSNLGDSWNQFMVGLGKSNTGVMMTTINLLDKIVGKMASMINMSNFMEQAFSNFGGQQYGAGRQFLHNISASLGLQSLFGGGEISQMLGYSNLAQEQITKANESLADAYRAQALLNQHLLRESQVYQKGQIDAETFMRRRAILKEGLAKVKGIITLSSEKGGKPAAEAVSPEQAIAQSAAAAEAKAPKYTQININISKMQASENLYIESGVKQSENQIANKVLEMLTGALNDSQRMAGAH